MRNGFNVYGRILSRSYPDAFAALLSSFWWPLRNYPDVVALTVITIIIVHRLRTKYYYRQDARDAPAQHSIQNPLVSLQGLRKKALAALVIGKNAIMEQEQYVCPDRGVVEE
uniref:Uncharacterized protein n=1 Tax=viral metagenome TaxID=1070528 RepID=A0A6M3KIB2_9ZZZZ